MSDENFPAQVVGVFLAETVKNIAKGSANSVFTNFRYLFYSEITRLGLNDKTDAAEISQKLEAEPKLLESIQEKLIENPKLVEEIKKMISEKPSEKGDVYNVTSYSQSGGITAGQINLTNLPEPEISYTEITRNKQNNGLYETVFLLSIESRVPIPNLFIRIDAETIERIDVGPQRAGMLSLGHSGKREGWAFTNIENAFGDYKIVATTNKPEDCKLTIE